MNLIVIGLRTAVAHKPDLENRIHLMLDFTKLTPAFSAEADPFSGPKGRALI
jgi:hypothetical protein